MQAAAPHHLPISHPTVTPHSLLDLGGGAVNELSYQQARNNRAAVGQAYVAEPGGWGAWGFGGGAPGCGAALGSLSCCWSLLLVPAHCRLPTTRLLFPTATTGYLLGKAGVPKHAIITGLAGTPTPDLAALVAALKVGGGEYTAYELRPYSCCALPSCCPRPALPHPATPACLRITPQGLRHGQRCPIEYFTFGDRHRRKSSILTMNWSWWVGWVGGRESSGGRALLGRAAAP